MADNRTGPAVQKLVESIQEDTNEVLDLFERGLEKLRTLQAQTKGINGLAGTLKAKGDEIDLAIGVIREEADKVAEKMMREPARTRPAITEGVDHGLAAAVVAAKELAS